MQDSMAKQAKSGKDSGQRAGQQRKMGKEQMNRTSRRILKVARRLFFVCVLVVLLYVVIVGGYAFGRALYTEKPVSSHSASLELVVSDGDSAWQVGRELERMGVIDSWVVFGCKAILFDCDVHSGTYTVSPSMTEREILETLSAEQTGVQEEE